MNSGLSQHELQMIYEGKAQPPAITAPGSTITEYQGLGQARPGFPPMQGYASMGAAPTQQVSIYGHCRGKWMTNGEARGSDHVAAGFSRGDAA